MFWVYKIKINKLNKNKINIVLFLIEIQSSIFIDTISHIYMYMYYLWLQPLKTKCDVIKQTQVIIFDL